MKAERWYYIGEVVYLRAQVLVINVCLFARLDRLLDSIEVRSVVRGVKNVVEFVF